MPVLTAQHPRDLPIWLTVPAWLTLFLSPTLYIVLLAALNKARSPMPPEWLSVSLFCLILIVALLGCETMVWSLKTTKAWRALWVGLTGLAMLLQVSVLLILIRIAITMAISLC